MTIALEKRLEELQMYVKEMFNGLNPANRPEAWIFNNNDNYSDVVIEKIIQENSFCEHHFLPYIGNVHVAYISKGKVIGLSKINRLYSHPFWIIEELP